MNTRVRQASRVVAFTSLGATLYAAGALATAYIQSPWGTGQFRPAVIIPSIFSILFGPFVGGLSAAIGTLVADSIKHGTLYLPSLVAAVPSNFVGFYLLGKLLEGRFSWNRFIGASLLALLVGNALCAALYTGYKVAIGALPSQLLPGLTVGLTVWWFSTMIPFQLLLLPPLLKALVRALPGLVPAEVKKECEEGVTPRGALISALLIASAPALILAVVTALSEDIALFFVGALPSQVQPVVRSLIVMMFAATGVGLAAASLYLALRGKATRRS